jgi:septum formation protein
VYTKAQKIPPIVLASSSPRRSEILDMLGIDHIVFKPGIDEDNRSADPGSLVRDLSIKKAEAAAEAVDGEIILSVDTVVVLEDVVMGKPLSDEEAGTMLRQLSGKWHHVFTGLTLLAPGEKRSVSGEETTAVKFKQVGEMEIQDYIRTGEPFDKAGGYGIQGRGSALVERIDGCYFNVVGLPVVKFLSMLNELGYRYGFHGLFRM